MKILIILNFLISLNVYSQEINQKNYTPDALNEKILTLRNAEEKAFSSYEESLKRQCRGIPKIDIGIIEYFSKYHRVNPASITLNRVVLKSSPILNRSSAAEPLAENLFCVGTFYTPSGAFDCEIEFREEGEIVQACRIGLSENYTHKLRQIWFNATVARSKLQTQLDTEMYGTKDKEICEAYRFSLAKGLKVYGSFFYIPPREKGSWHWIREGKPETPPSRKDCSW